jgi:hypothetical protein
VTVGIEQNLGRQFHPWTGNGRLTDSVTGEFPERMYRVVPGREMADYEARGAIKSKAGVTHFSSQPDPRYPGDYSPSEPHHILEVATDPSDDYYDKNNASGDTYVAVRNAIPMSRVTGRWDYPDRRSFRQAFED